MSALFVTAYSQVIKNGTYYSLLHDDEKVITELSLIFKEKDSITMQLYINDDNYFLKGTYKIKNRKIKIKYHNAQLDLAGTQNYYNENINYDSILNLRIILENNIIDDSSKIEKIKVNCENKNNDFELLSIKPIIDSNQIYLNIPPKFIPFEIRIKSNKNRTAIINVEKNFDYEYRLFLAHDVKILDSKTNIFIAQINNINDDSFKIKINNEYILMKFIK